MPSDQDPSSLEELKSKFLAEPVHFFEADWSALGATLTDFIRDHVPGNAVLGLSGGIDSSLVAFLTVRALGKDRLHGIMMPSKSNVAEDEDYAKIVANSLDISHETITIQPIVNAFQQNVPHAREFALDNLKPRIRMSILYTYANHHSACVLGTGNYPEIMVGYFTKYGDGGVDLEPIGDLYKQQVKGLARFLGVPPEIVDRPPSAGLWPGQTDEGELGITYLKIDQILCGKRLGCTSDELLNHLPITREELEKVSDMVSRSQHKRVMPPTRVVNPGMP